MKKRKNSGAIRIKAHSVVKSIAVGSLTGIIVWVLLLVAAAFLISDTEEPENLVMPAVFVLAALSSVTAGLVSSKLAGVKSIAPGAFAGGVLLLLVWVLSLAISGRSNDVSLLLRLILCVDLLVK